MAGLQAKQRSGNRTMLLNEVVIVSRSVSRAAGRLEKIERLAGLLRRLDAGEAAIAVAFLSGDLRQGRIGIGYATLQNARPEISAATSALTLTQVDAAFEHIKSLSGPGSALERGRALRELLGRATPDEEEFLRRLLLGELRQGALEGVMVEAIARAAELPAADIRRAVMLAGDLTEVARAALGEGAAGLSRFSFQLFRPIQPMLAQSAEGIADALYRLETAGLEFKLDGARVQVHRAGDEVAVFTRSLKDVTAAVPEVVQAVRSLAVSEIVLDGEVIALRSDDRPQPFQTTMRRFGRKLDVTRMREQLPLTPFFFDCLFLDGASLLDDPAADRASALAGVLPPSLIVPRTVTGDRDEAEAFLESALAAGHEGIMAKRLDAPYESGSRGRTWLKVKPAHTLDLVVLAAEWGHGRRRGRLSNLHLGARDPAGGGFVMLGKTFKGLTDEMLAWQTRRLQALEIARDDVAVYVRPELVVEIAFNEIQASPHYPGGLALRFARVKRYRPDKSAGDADTIDTVRAIYASRAEEKVDGGL